MTPRNERGFTLVELLIVVAIIGILAAICVAQVMRARVAGNEASAIGSIRVINTAQQGYVQMCQGFAVTLPELRGSAGNFISPDMAAGAGVTKSGYTFAVTPGASAVAITSAPAACTGPQTNYYVSAVPVGTITGSRAFASNAQGTIFFLSGLTAPAEASFPTGSAIQ